jgi:hypothetical protein
LIGIGVELVDLFVILKVSDIQPFRDNGALCEA